MKIVMQDTACGPNGNFYSGQTYEVGKHISKEQAEAFIKGRHATVLDEKAEARKAETAEAEKAPETTAERTQKIRPGRDKQ